MKIMAATADELVPDCQDVYEARRIVACNDDNALLGSAQAGPQAIEKDDEKHKLWHNVDVTLRAAEDDVHVSSYMHQNTLMTVCPSNALRSATVHLMLTCTPASIVHCL